MSRREGSRYCRGHESRKHCGGNTGQVFLPGEYSQSTRLCYSKDKEPNLTCSLTRVQALSLSLSSGAAFKPESLGSEPELWFLLHIHSPFRGILRKFRGFHILGRSHCQYTENKIPLAAGGPRQKPIIKDIPISPARPVDIQAKWNRQK